MRTGFFAAFVVASLIAIEAQSLELVNHVHAKVPSVASSYADTDVAIAAKNTKLLTQEEDEKKAKAKAEAEKAKKTATPVKSVAEAIPEKKTIASSTDSSAKTEVNKTAQPLVKEESSSKSEAAPKEEPKKAEEKPATAKEDAPAKEKTVAEKPAAEKPTAEKKDTESSSATTETKK